jgi:hypothetical protein
MDDFTHCPICNDKMRVLHGINLRLDKKILSLTERLCVKGMNHCLQSFSDPQTNEVVMIKTSLNPKFTKYVELYYLTNHSKILLCKDGGQKEILIDKLIEPDFPNLDKLRKKVDLFIIFS